MDAHKDPDPDPDPKKIGPDPQHWVRRYLRIRLYIYLVYGIIGYLSTYLLVTTLEIFLQLLFALDRAKPSFSLSPSISSSSIVAKLEFWKRIMALMFVKCYLVVRIKIVKILK